MDFEDTPEEAAFRKQVSEFLSANAKLKGAEGIKNPYAPTPPDYDRTDVSESKAWQKKKADAGWACLTWPKEYGGRDASTMESIIWGQEEAKYDVPPNVFGIGQGIHGPVLMAHGTPEQKDKHLNRLLTGEDIWCQLFSEPGAGSDLAAVRTKAERDGDEWVINGQKIWTSGAQYCDYGILLTRTDPNVAKHKGLTMFIVDMKSPGIDIRPIKQITGGAVFNEVFFDNVRIPHSWIIGEADKGWDVTITVLMNERKAISSPEMAVNMDPNNLIDLVKSVMIDGKPAIEDTSVRQKLAHYLTLLKAAENNSSRMLSALSGGGIPGPEGSLNKLLMPPLIQEIASFLTELQGTMSSVRDPEYSEMEAFWQDYYLGIPGMRIGGGTDEIQRNIIGERILGLPAEPRLDKDLAFNQVPVAGS